MKIITPAVKKPDRPSLTFSFPSVNNESTANAKPAIMIQPRKLLSSVLSEEAEALKEFL
ncbi:hypothetical protein [Kangiella geojedonensis]|uniref:hypothetical protein n=1 Tax=Kangiella geojedonensis TaxID=914150 RepID=UPI00146FD636|nr:hypothetical protein [Kangiella geojedonensis]